MTEEAPFAPFLLVADPAILGGAAGLVDLVALHGAGELRWLARFAGWSDAVAARERCRAAGGGPGRAAPAHRFLSDPVHQYFLASGRTS